MLDQHAHVVRTYGADGVFLHDAGREGQGPGEFSDFVNTVLVGAGDSIYVPDYAQARINVFSSEGAYGRTISVPSRPNGYSWAWSETGDLYYRGMTMSRNDENRFVFWDAILHVDRDGGELDTVFVFDYQSTGIGGPGNIRVPLIINSPVLGCTSG